MSSHHPANNENIPPDESSSADCISRVHNDSYVSRRSCQSPYSSKLPVCSSASSEDGEVAAQQQENQDSEMQEKEVKRERRRNRVKQEIMATEKTYQGHLDLIVKFFEAPLRRAQLIPDHITVTIFSNIHQIISINRELSEHLQSLSIGCAFLEMAPFLKLYSTYANNHERALATLMEWEQKCSELSVFRRAQEDNEEMQGLKLNALLITPVQRIPRYKLLLEELQHFTSKDDEDYTFIEEAIRRISEVANHINSHIKQQDNFMKMLAIQKSLSGPVAPRILTPGRIFIKDGPLKKVSKKGGRSQERMFFLFSDILMYAKSRLLDSHHQAYVCCCIMPLQHCMVSRVFGNDKDGQMALFTVSCKTESLLLYSDQKTVDSWIAALTKAIGQLVKNRKSLRKDSSVKTPLRKAALAKLTKMEKMDDPLNAAMKKNSPLNSPKKHTKKSSSSDNRNLHHLDNSTVNLGCLSPRKRLQNLDFPRLPGCLSPRSRMGRKKVKLTGEEGGKMSPGGGEMVGGGYPVTPPPQPVVPSSPVDLETHHQPHPRRSNTFTPPPSHTARHALTLAWATPDAAAAPTTAAANETVLAQSINVDAMSDPFRISYASSDGYDEDSEHEIQRFIAAEKEDDETEIITEPETEVSLSESDLLSLFAAADALDSGLQSHLYSCSDSSSFSQSKKSSLSRIPEQSSAPPSPIPPSEGYDYNNYMPKFANLYRTPVKSDALDSSSVFASGNEESLCMSVKRTPSFKAATGDQVPSDSVFDSPAPICLSKIPEDRHYQRGDDTTSLASKSSSSSSGSGHSVRDMLPSVDAAMDAANKAIDAASNINPATVACSIQ